MERDHGAVVPSSNNVITERTQSPANERRVPANPTPERTSTTLKVFLPNGGFNIVKFRENISVKVRFNEFLNYVELFARNATKATHELLRGF